MTSIYRAAEAGEIAAQLRRSHPPIIAVTGAHGSGRTSLLDEVEHLVTPETADESFGLTLHHVPWRDDAEHNVINLHLLEHFEWVDAGSARDVTVIDDLDLLTLLHMPSAAVDHATLMFLFGEHHAGHRLLVTLQDRYWDKLVAELPELTSRMHRVRLGELPTDALRQIVQSEAAALTGSDHLAIDDEVVDAALAPALPTDQLTHPGLALSRIDAAVGRARHVRSDVVGVEHLQLGDLRAVPTTAADLSARLSEGVRGQDRAIAEVSERLAPALAGLKLRADRPHGVFLFAGPSGVGKTELARQLARVVYGSADALIRLDMSEYANENDGRAKLIGAHRSWKNSSTEGLLTTRVIAQPNSVVLLDEFEKASPDIFSLFLQVFDEGRLTDGWGQVADFSPTIVVMTSNLGVAEASARPVGFGGTDSFDTARQLDAISRTLPREVLGRVTSIVPFDPLSADVLHELAEIELERVVDLLDERGRVLEYTEAVVTWLAETGVEPAFGARYLQSNIQKHVFPLLLSRQERKIRLDVTPDGQLVIAAG